MQLQKPDVPTCVCSKFQEVGVKLEQAIIRWIVTSLMPREFLVSARELDQIFSSAKRQAPIITSDIVVLPPSRCCLSAVRD